MMSSSRWLGILSLLLPVALAFFLLLPSDEKKIHHRFDELADFCSSPQGEGMLDSLAKAAGGAKLCPNPCRVTIPSLQLDQEFNQKEISDHILMLKKRLPETRFSFHDSVIELTGDNSARVVTTLRLDGKTAADGRFVDAYELDIRMEKNQGDWYFSSFLVVEFMKR